MVFSVASSYVGAIDTSGYVQIREVKSWKSVVDIILVDGQKHQCGPTLQTTFKVSVADSHHISFALSAFTAGKKVRLRYGCNSNGEAIVTGIRIQ